MPGLLTKIKVLAKLKTQFEFFLNWVFLFLINKSWTFIEKFYFVSADKLIRMKKDIRVFIVEDAHFLREMLCLVLKKPGVEIVGTALSVDTALSQIRTLQPDIVLLDLVLPGENGVSLISKIYAVSPQTEIIVCSSLLPQEEILLQCEMAGAMNFINKPFSSAEILDMIYSIIRQNEQTEMAA
ncbi:MAG: response regulator [Bdellovibrionales bacterium]|nr:response regulator [Bdellovibrionales bacterium]